MPEEPERATLDAALARVVEREPEVLAAWLFGSRATGAVRATSDADVAVLLAPGTERALLTRLAASLENALAMDVDVVDLATVTPVLGFEIVARGRRVFTRDALAADRAEERCLREYLDTAYLRRVQHHYLYGDPL